MSIKTVFYLLVTAYTFYLMISEKKAVPEGVVSQEPLTNKLKAIIWILCLLDPLIAGTIFYYGWRKKLPTKAKTANYISLWAFLIILAVLFILYNLAPAK